MNKIYKNLLISCTVCKCKAQPTLIYNVTTITLLIFWKCYKGSRCLKSWTPNHKFLIVSHVFCDTLSGKQSYYEFVGWRKLKFE